MAFDVGEDTDAWDPERKPRFGSGHAVEYDGWGAYRSGDMGQSRIQGDQQVAVAQGRSGSGKVQSADNGSDPVGCRQGQGRQVEVLVRSDKQDGGVGLGQQLLDESPPRFQGPDAIRRAGGGVDGDDVAWCFGLELILQQLPGIPRGVPMREKQRIRIVDGKICRLGVGIQQVQLSVPFIGAVEVDQAIGFLRLVGVIDQQVAIGVVGEDLGEVGHHHDVVFRMDSPQLPCDGGRPDDVPQGIVSFQDDPRAFVLARASEDRAEVAPTDVVCRGDRDVVEETGKKRLQSNAVPIAADAGVCVGA